DYYFLSTREFISRVQKEEFLEWEEVYEDQFYGTLRSEVDRIWANKKSIVFDIEVNGATNLKEYYGSRALAVFIKPPSPEVLFERLKKRKTETEKSLQRRKARAARELKFENSFDTVLLNDDLATALEDAEKIVRYFLELDATEKT
ncbi:MAG: guanylate kinase, partial [Saprospiraceae bacterium]|nr:guanylate kinase [Saprospiraceae bacterium]